MGTIYLGLGSNVGDRKVNLRRALKLFSPRVKVEARSPLYDTDPMYLTDQPRYYNMVVRAKTELTPPKLLSYVRGIETEMGRAGKTHNRPRVIDIDILFYDDLVVATPDLEIPHPRIAERAFVLAPLVDIAPKLIHPTLKKSVKELLAQITDWQDLAKRTTIKI